MIPRKMAPDHGEVRLEGLLYADNGMPRQRERSEKLVGGLTELLPLAEGDEERDRTSGKTEPEVSGVGDRTRHLVEEHVARDAAADPAEHGHHEDLDHREVFVFVVIRALGQQPTVERIDGRCEEIDQP
jgi:hypothetical protein